MTSPKVTSYKPITNPEPVTDYCRGRDDHRRPFMAPLLASAEFADREVFGSLMEAKVLGAEYHRYWNQAAAQRDRVPDAGRIRRLVRLERRRSFRPFRSVGR